MSVVAHHSKAVHEPWNVSYVAIVFPVFWTFRGGQRSSLLRSVSSLSLAWLPQISLLAPGAWALKKSLTRPVPFLYFREIRKIRSHWPGGQSDLRLYNSYNLCPLARPAHVGEYGPTAQAQVQVLQKKRKLDDSVKIYNPVSARKLLTKSKKKNYREHSNIKVHLSAHRLAQCPAKWQRGCKEFQHLAGIKPS